MPKSKKLKTNEYKPYDEFLTRLENRNILFFERIGDFKVQFFPKMATPEMKKVDKQTLDLMGIKHKETNTDKKKVYNDPSDDSDTNWS